MELEKIVAVLEKELDLEMKDAALNGVQVDRRGDIQRLVSAVDFCEATLKQAIKKKADALLVHHGLYWGAPFPITGRYYQLIKALLDNNIALVAVHLPLDVALDFGNNHSLIKALGLTFQERFGNYKGLKLLFSAVPNPTAPPTYHHLVERFKEKVGTPLLSLAHGPSEVKKVAVCTGGGLFGIEDAKKAGCDTFITGDASHIAYHLTRELSINLLCGGHYNTETFGVINLGNKLAQTCHLTHEFIDLPTQL